MVKDEHGITDEDTFRLLVNETCNSGGNWPSLRKNERKIFGYLERYNSIHIRVAGRWEWKCRIES